MGSREWGKPALEGCCPELSERPACFSCENRSVPDFAIAPIKGDQSSRGKKNRCVPRRVPLRNWHFLDVARTVRLEAGKPVGVNLFQSRSFGRRLLPCLIDQVLF